MTSVIEHYETHLAPIYVWMAGGIDAAIARGQAEVDAVCPRPKKGQLAVDLGAGFGMHAIPLANLGYSVLAIDSSTTLLEAMQGYIGTLPIRTAKDDLLLFRRHLRTQAALILCMGDTLTHLPDLRSVEGLIADVAESLDEEGRLIITFRDYSTPLNGLSRFIPVRSDADRILACFLEYEEGAVTVHDILHERQGSTWQQCVSAYRKLRLSADWVTHALEVQGFMVRKEQGLAGMVRLIATRPL
jgi:2-polyprenyl-3-methyl-5-hydroxy-6-metoxy-1,4-benzoquinol methylase